MADKGATGIPVTKNETVMADIVGLTHEGDGVGRVDGFTLFIRGALPGERVRAKVLKVKKTYGYAKLLELLEASPDRTDAPCPIHAQCGGCQLQHLSYPAQLRWKRQHVIDSLQRIGKLDVAGEAGVRAGSTAERAAADRTRTSVENAADGLPEAAPAEPSGEASPQRDGSGAAELAGGIVVHETLGMDEPWRYRNKAQVPIGSAPADGVSGGGADGGAGSTHLIGGFYAQGSHRIIDMDACLIQDGRNDEAVRIVKQIGNALGVRAYDEASGRGLLRHVVVRSGFATGETMVVLVTNGARLPRADEWIAQIREALPGVTSIVQNVNTKRTNVIFGDETKLLWGSEVIYDELDGIRFAISARSFYQVNPQQTVALYRKAVEYARLTGDETVIDAYCGIGTISLFLARQAGQVYGVEVVPEAIQDARRNAELNGIANATFEVGLSEEVMPRWRAQGIQADVIVVDPPRKGCDEALLETILQMRPPRVVYVSCNPATLARDLRVLEGGGYKAVEVQPVDMFPHTTHVECVVGICRVDT
ncbi:23S rRNA (uracil(1939)-C(5))-methyltransferase RlmD [Paenibacillus sabuli]|nr:23S rRNA (uracil(1939)-C(5))-methyltransferase RlmD [Paenibacillus sabuli]